MRGLRFGETWQQVSEEFFVLWGWIEAHSLPQGGLHSAGFGAEVLKLVPELNAQGFVNARCNNSVSMLWYTKCQVRIRGGYLWESYQVGQQ